VIELRNVWFSYVDNRYVLKDINISFERGVTVIMGPNGSGKTTLLKVASCIYRPTKGEVIIDNTPYWRLSEQRRLEYRRKIVYLHEKPILLKGRVEENIAYGLTIRGYDKREASKKVHEIARYLNIVNLLNKRASDLSIGEKQLVALARALVIDPEYLFLDEPLSHLHMSKRERIIELIRSMKNKIVVIVTHDIFLTLTIANKVVVLDEGRIIQIGNPQHILKKKIIK